jgi:superfamily II DNA helicase RecQ
MLYLVVNLPVGYGKSLIYYILPSVLGRGKASYIVVVVSLLNIIKKDQLDSLKLTLVPVD